MFKVVEFDVEHIKPLLEEPMNSGLTNFTKNDFQLARYLKRTALAKTVMFGGEVMLCAFVVRIWSGRGYLVIVLSEKIKKHSVAVYRGIASYLPTLPFNRLEFDVPCDFELGHRRARFLGFKLMCEKARRYLPGDGDASVYEWVRP